MDLLIDTHIVLWFQESNPALPNNILALIEDPDNTIYLSQASLFEIAIKLTLGKLPNFVISVEQLINQILADDIKILPISNQHITTYNRIPFLEKHRAPSTGLF